jgi:hypothetical protein
MKIGYVTADWSDIEDPSTGHPTFGGSGWYRVGLPSQYMNRNGVESVACELISAAKDGHLWLHDWNGKIHDDCDIIVFQRWMGEDAPEVIRKARAAGQIVVNDVDDWYWGLHPTNEAYKASDPKVHPTCNRDHYWKALEASDAITVSTPFLREKLKDMPGDVVLLRNAIDLERWTARTVSGTAHNVGWVGSTLHRSGDLETLKGIIGPFVDQYGLEFVHCGMWNRGVTAGQQAGVSPERETTYPIVSILEYPDLVKKIELGLVPLNDVPFNHAKSAIKGMEYAASGIPFVAQRTPEYDWLSEECGVGLTANKPKEWVRRLASMMDLETYRMHAIDNRAHVAQLDMKIKVHDWISAYESFLR